MAEEHKLYRMNGIAPPGIYTNDKGDQIQVTWEEYDQTAWYELLKKKVEEVCSG